MANKLLQYHLLTKFDLESEPTYKKRIVKGGTFGLTDLVVRLRPRNQLSN